MADKRRALDKLLSSEAPSEFSVYGGTKAERYTDKDLARLAEVPSLTSVDLQMQTFAKLPSSLAALPNLAVLRLNSCGNLESLAGIEKLVHLRELHLGLLREIDFKRELRRLAELPDLATLCLNGRNITLPPAAAIPSVIALELFDGRLDLELALRSLAKLSSLRSLQLGWVSSFAVPDTVASLQQVRQLTLESRGVLTLSPAIAKLVKLETLSVGRLRKIPDAIFECSSLVELHLQGTFKSIPAAIGKLSRLRILELPWRGRYEVPDELFRLKLKSFEGPTEIARKVEYTVSAEEDANELLDLESYQFKFGDLDAVLARLAHAPKLTSLSVGGVDTTTLPAAIGKLAALEVLVLATPKLVSVSPEIGRLARLRELRFRSATELTNVPSTIGDLASLELVDFRSNPKLVIPGSIGKLSKLATLLANTELPDGIAGCAALATIRWSITTSPSERSLAALGKLAALRDLAIEDARTIDLDAVGRALADHPVERLDFGRCAVTGDDLSKPSRACARST